MDVVTSRRRSSGWKALFLCAGLAAAGVATVLALLDASGSDNRLGPARDSERVRYGRAPDRAGLEDRARVRFARWHFRAASLEELASRAALAVEATVVSIAQGETLPDDSAYHDSGVETQNVALRVRGIWYGEAPETITVTKTGTQSTWLEGDPPYQVGENYVLFINALPDGRFIPPGPDGRLLIDGSRLRSFVDGPVARDAERRTLEEFRSQARTAKAQND